MTKATEKIKTYLRTRSWRELGYVIASLMAAFIIGGIILAILQFNPLEVYLNIFVKAFTDFGQVLRRSTALLLTALAVVIPIKCGMLNLGGEGQIMAGAFAAAIVGSGVSIIPGLHPIVAILAATAVGAFFGWLPAMLKIKFGASEVVVTIMMNYIISYMCEYLTLYRFSGTETAPRTALVLESAKLPRAFEGAEWSVGLFIALGMCFLMAFMMNKTTLGLELKSAGLNAGTARYLGIDVKRLAVLSMVIGGALAGMGGALEVLGGKYSYYVGYFNNYGFDGVAISYMAMGSPIAILFTTIIIAVLKTGMLSVERSIGVSNFYGTALQGIIITMLVCPYIMQSLFKGTGNVLGRRRRTHQKRREAS